MPLILTAALAAALVASAANSSPKPAGGTAGAHTEHAAQSAPAESPRRKMCNARHYSSSALCSDSTCKMREYRKWNSCLKTGSYN